jgi:starch-binding outer membrane protein, SusD/RagB family
MKKFFNRIVIIIAGLVGLAACEDFLDREPLGRYTTETYPTGGLTQYVYGMYSELRSWGVIAFPFVGIVSITSDDADKGSTPADAPDMIQFDNFTVTPTNGLVRDFYTAHYAAINKANVVLNEADSLLSAGAVSQEDFNLSTAEAKFVRGYLYFMLVRTFGAVPKVDALVTDQGDFNIPRAPVADIYALIESDLQFAAANLPLTWDAAFIGRPTSGAANGLIAKVYAYEKKWAQSLAAAQTVINSGVYDLSTAYDKIFTEVGENSKESLFEIQNIRDESFNFGSDYARIQGVRGSGQWDFGWGFNMPSTQLIAAYEANDPRREATILYAGETTPYGETLPPHPSVLPNPRYNQKVYTNPSYRLAANNLQADWVNARILRYADVVLIAAEAANELGQTTVALDYLEMVRARARAGNASILPKITTTNPTELRDKIRQERRIELAMEHDRFYDLVRWGIAAQTLHAAGKTDFVAGKHELMPIPQDEIDRSNGVLTQNPGY